MAEIFEGGAHWTPCVTLDPAVRERLEKNIFKRALGADEVSAIETALNDYCAFKAVNDLSPRLNEIRTVIGATGKALRKLAKQPSTGAKNTGDRVLKEAALGFASGYTDNEAVLKVIGALLQDTNVLESAAAACDEALGAIDSGVSQGKGGGQRGNPHFRTLVMALADIFEQAGMRPTSGWDETANTATLEDRTGAYRNTPFMQLVDVVQRALPPEFQVQSDFTLGDMISEGLAFWRHERRKG